MILFFALVFVPGWAADNVEMEMLSLLMKGRYALAKGDEHYASEIAEKALALDPNEAEAAFFKAEVLLDMRSRQPLLARQIESDLIVLLRDYLARFPHDYRFHKMMGIRLANRQASGRLNGLEAPHYYLEKAIELLSAEPGNHDLELADARYYLGIWHYNNKSYFDAAEAFRKVVALEGGVDWAWFYGARSLEESHQLNSAVRFYTRYQENAGDNPSYRGPNISFNILTLKVILDETEPNIVALLDFFKRENYDREVIYATANRFLGLSRFELCLRMLALVKPGLRDDTYYALLSHSLSAQHKYGDLYTELAAAMAAPQGLTARATLARLAQEAALLAGDYEAAVSMRNWRGAEKPGPLASDVYAAFAASMQDGDDAMWAQVLAWHGREPAMQTIAEEVKGRGLAHVAAQILTDLYMKWSDWDAALETGKTVAAGLADEDRASDDLAVLYYLNGDPERSFELYEELLQREPARHDFLNNYGYFLAEQETDLIRARACLERAIGQESNNGAYLDSLGWIHYKLGDYSSAETYILRALAVEPGDAEKLEHLGDVLFAQGRTTEARKHWSHAMAGAGDRYRALLKKLDPP